MADAGADRAQDVGAADAGALQQQRRLNGPGADDDLAPGRDVRGRPPVPDADPGHAGTAVAGGAEQQVATAGASGDSEVAARTPPARPALRRLDERRLEGCGLGERGPDEGAVGGGAPAVADGGRSEADPVAVMSV